MAEARNGRRARIVNHRQLDVYRRAFDASMEIFELSKRFPKEEMYSLTSQIRRSSRSVSSNLAEAWRKRRYGPAFVAKLSDAESEAAETQTWIEYAVKCDYLDRTPARALYREYDAILKTLVGMMMHAEAWLLPPVPAQKTPFSKRN